MLIFILPSSLYLKITNQDGDKGTQRIWVCLIPATLIFLISFSLKFAKEVVRLCRLILLLAASKKGSSPVVFLLRDLNYFIRILFPQNYLFRYYSYCTFAFALSSGGACWEDGCLSSYVSIGEALSLATKCSREGLEAVRQTTVSVQFPAMQPLCSSGNV